MDTEYAASTFRSSFSKLTDEDMARFLDLAERRRCRRDETVIEEGDDYLAVNMVVSGEVRVEVKQTVNGRPDTIVELARLGPGAVFGEMAYLERSGASATVSANEEVELLYIDGRKIDDLIAGDPAFGSRFYESLACTLASRVRDTNRRVLMVARSRKDRRTGIERRKDWFAED